MRTLILLLSVCFPLVLFGGYSQVNNKWSPDRYVPKYSVHEHYDRGCEELRLKNWDKALTHFMIICYHYQDSPFYHDAIFYSGVSYYQKGEYDLANKQFDYYLSLGGKLKNFEKIFDYKLEIANHYAQGTKKHIFGYSKLPKWASAKNDAISLYDEIIAALPAKDIAALAQYNKADLLRAKRKYSQSIEALQTLARRFPKHALAAESYLRISEIYLEESKLEAQNPDLIALAHVNLQRFLKSFPSDERAGIAKQNLLAMQEVYARSLYDTGRFYERKKQPTASRIYYEDTMRKYPGTQAAAKSEERLARLGTTADKSLVIK